MACAIGMELGIRIGPGQLAASDEFSEVPRHRTDVVRYQRRPGDAAARTSGSAIHSGMTPRGNSKSTSGSRRRMPATIS